jgi:hypothetical protein
MVRAQSVALSNCVGKNSNQTMKSKQIKWSEIVFNLERIVTEVKKRPFEAVPVWQFNKEDPDGVICSIRFERGKNIVEMETAMQLVVGACRGLLPFAEALSQQPGATIGSKDAVSRARAALDTLTCAR